VGLIVPTAFGSSLGLPDDDAEIRYISRASAVILLFGYLVFCFFQLRSHHGLVEAALQQDDHKDADKHRDMYKEKLTFTECVLALVIAITCVTFMAVFLVEKIEYIVVEHGVKDA
jgi:Ca2+:H+ antiporter